MKYNVFCDKCNRKLSYYDLLYTEDIVLWNWRIKYICSLCKRQELGTNTIETLDCYRENKATFKTTKINIL